MAKHLRKETRPRRYVDESKMFYMKESKTIDFNQSQPKRPRKPIELIPQSINQEKYIIALTDPETDIVMVSGPAGTGKTYLAMLAAIKAMKQGDCEKILLTRPAISIESENHGFLPGNLNSKLEPWVKPLMDVIKEYYSSTEIEYFLKEEIIEFAPLGMMRGRTFKKTWLIADEMQNATPNMFKMLLTRIGENSKIILTGDTDQADRSNGLNGLLDLKNKLNSSEVPGMIKCEFTTKDIKRHAIIEHILKLYDK